MRDQILKNSKPKMLGVTSLNNNITYCQQLSMVLIPQ